MIGCLLIHGYTGSQKELQPLIDFLEEETEWLIRVPILPGHGETLNLKEKTYQEWLYKAERTIFEMKKKCQLIYVIGFSMGGLIASYIASKHKIDKLVLLAPARKILPLKELTRTLIEMIGDAVNHSLDRNILFTHVSERFGQIPFEAYKEFLKLKMYVEPKLKYVHIPVLIIQGTRDGLVRAESVAELAEEFGSNEVEVVLIDEENHFLCLGENKQVVNNHILRFLSHK